MASPPATLSAVPFPCGRSTQGPGRFPRPRRNRRDALLLVLAVLPASMIAAHAREPGAEEAPPPGQVVQSATAPAALDMHGAIDAALSWHPRIRDALGSFQQYGDYVDVARGGYLPQVRAGLNTEQGNREIAGYDSRRLHRFTMTVSQMLYDFGKVSSEVDLAQAQRASEQAGVLLAIDDVAREAAQAWIEVDRQKTLLEIAREQSHGITAIADLVRERHARGAAPLSDEMQARSREEAARANEVEAEAQLQRWRTRLQLLTRTRTLPETAGEPAAELQGACAAGEARLPPPQVLMAQAQQLAAQADVRRVRAGSLPTLSLDGSVSRGLDDASRQYGDYDGTVMLNLSGPLYEGGGNRARQRAAGHGLTAADAALERARLDARQSLQDARLRASGYQARERLLAGRTDSIEQTRGLYRQQYLDLGTRSLLDLLNAEQEYQLARLDAANNRYELQRVQVDCLYASGRMREAFASDPAQLEPLETFR